MKTDFKLLSVIIPVYNEESTVGEVIERVSKVKLPLKKEIIVVDDGSNDGTTEVLRKTQTEVEHHYLTPVNIGKGAAVRIGLSLAKGDIILLQDADLELNPDEYLNLLEPILNGSASVVYGSRFLRKNHNVPRLRRIANQFLTLTTNIVYKTRLTDMETAYKVFTAETAKAIRLKCNRFDIEPEITARIAQAGYKIYEVPISYNPRTISEGKKIRWQDGIKAFLTLFRCKFTPQNEKSSETKPKLVR